MEPALWRLGPYHLTQFVHQALQIVHEHRHPSTPEPPSTGSRPAERFRCGPTSFHAGPLAGVTHFAAEPGRPSPHAAARRDARTHPLTQRCAAQPFMVNEPTLLFYRSRRARLQRAAGGQRLRLRHPGLPWTAAAATPSVQAPPPLVASCRWRRCPTSGTACACCLPKPSDCAAAQTLLANRLFEVLLPQTRHHWTTAADHGMQTGLLLRPGPPKLARHVARRCVTPGAPWSLRHWLQRACRAAALRPSSTPAGHHARRVFVALARLARAVDAAPGTPRSGGERCAGLCQRCRVLAAFTQAVGQSPLGPGYGSAQGPG